jgi:hypothetical protein
MTSKKCGQEIMGAKKVCYQGFFVSNEIKEVNLYNNNPAC